MKPAALNVDRTQLKLIFERTEHVYVIRMCGSECVYVRMRTLWHNYNACVLCNTAACSVAQQVCSRQRALRHHLITIYNGCARACVYVLSNLLCSTACASHGSPNQHEGPQD